MGKDSDWWHGKRGTLLEIKALVADMIHQMLSSCISLGDVIEGDKANPDLLQVDKQLIFAIETLLKIRSRIIFLTSELALLWRPI